MTDQIKVMEVTWERAFKVWWSLLWRGLLFGFLGGALLGFILGVVLGIAKVEPETIKKISQVGGFIISVPIGVAVTRMVLQRKYSDFRIALIEK